MKLSLTQVKKVAELANLPLTEHSEEKYASELSNILDYIDQLNSADTKGAEPTFNVTDLSNVLAEDEVSTCLTQDEAVQNAPLSKEGFFITKGVFEE